jgi:hypothetical protein
MAYEQVGNGTVELDTVDDRPCGVVRGAVRLLLLLPFIGVFWAPPFERVDPLWYLAFWITISAGLVYTVYRAEN